MGSSSRIAYRGTVSYSFRLFSDNVICQKNFVLYRKLLRQLLQYFDMCFFKPLKCFSIHGSKNTSACLNPSMPAFSCKRQIYRKTIHYRIGGGEGSRTPVRNRIPANVYEHMPPIKFPIVNSDGRKRTTGSFINAEPPQSLSGSVPCADRRAGGPDLMTLIAGGTGDRRVNAAALSSLQRSIISCV